MANNHEQFVAFHEAIKANDTRLGKLKVNRKALRDRIRNHFKNNLSDESNNISDIFTVDHRRNKPSIFKLEFSGE